MKLTEKEDKITNESKNYLRAIWGPMLHWKIQKMMMSSRKGKEGKLNF